MFRFRGETESVFPETTGFLRGRLSCVPETWGYIPPKTETFGGTRKAIQPAGYRGSSSIYISYVSIFLKGLRTTKKPGFSLKGIESGKH